MKILLMGDASNYHRTLGTALQRLGHEVTVASDGSGWMRTGRDIDLDRRDGPLGGALLWTRLNTVLVSRLRGYDVVQVHNPVFLRLQPHRVRAVFDRLRRSNGSVFLTALGTDTPYVDMCLAADSPLRYNELRVGDTHTPYMMSADCAARKWQQPLLRDHCRYIYDNVDGVVSALYEYHLACERVLDADRLAYAGIPIDTRTIAESAHPENGAAIAGQHDTGINIMIACHKEREGVKGVDRIAPVVQQAAAENPGRVNVEMVQNVPYEQFKEILDRADIVVDQLYSYTPATTALMAMAKGKVVISGAEPEYYDFIGEDRLHPIINADPQDLEALRRRIMAMAADPGTIAVLQRHAREFVLKHNDAEVVARRFVDFWERRMAR